MRPVRIELSNHRQYKHQVIFFPQDGLIGIVGSNGAGKSTLFNAMQWAFYGKIKDVNSSMIKNQAAGAKERSFVEVDFIYQNRLYRVRRDLVSSRCFAQIKSADTGEWQTKAVGVTPLNDYMQNTVFKMDHKAFCTCYYAEQDDFDALIKLNPEPRKKTLTKLLGIDSIEQAKAAASSDARKLKEENEKALKELSAEEELLKNKAEADESEAALKQKSAIISEEGKALTASRRELLEKREEGRKGYEEHQRLVAEKEKAEVALAHEERGLKAAEESLKTLLDSKERLAEIAPYKAVYQDSLEKREAMGEQRARHQEKIGAQKEMEKLKAELVSRKTEYERLKDKAAAFDGVDREIAELSEISAAKQEEAVKIREDMQRVAFEVQSAKAEYEKLKGMLENASCPTCKRPLEQHGEEEIARTKTELSELVAKAKALQAEGKELEAKLKAKNAEAQEIAKKLEAAQAKAEAKAVLKTQFSVLKEEAEKKKADYKAQEERFEAVKDAAFDEEAYKELAGKIAQAKPLHDEAIGIEKAVEAIPSLEEKASAAKKAANASKEAAESFGKAVAELNFDKTAYESVNGQIERAQEAIDAKKDEKAKAEAAITAMQGEKKALEEKIAALQAVKDRVSENLGEMALLNKLAETLEAYRVDKLSKLAPALSEIMSDMIAQITEGKYDQVELDNDYDVHIYRQGVKNPLEFYSGGEKKLAALCQRIAISNLLVQQTGQAKFDMLAMDEVFGSMDGARQDNIMSLLRNLNEMFPQILIVTHSEQVKEGFDHILEIKQDKDGFSTASWDSDWGEEEVRALVGSSEEESEADAS